MPNKLKPGCFDIVNYNGKAVLFRTDDVSVNKFTFSIINLTGAPLELTGGRPVNPLSRTQPADGGGSSFNVGFESMLTADVMKTLKLSLPDEWDAAFFEGDKTTPASWSVAPRNKTTLEVNQQVKITIENIKCSSTRPGNFEILYCNIPGYADSSFPVSKHLDVINPPDPQKKTLPLTAGYINPVHPVQGQVVREDEELNPDELTVISDGEAVPVYITYDSTALIRNGFTYVLTNTSKDPLAAGAIQPYRDLSDGEQPALYISFLFGEEDYAIATQDTADNSIFIDAAAKLPWTPVSHAAGTSYWQFFPQSPHIIAGYDTIKFPIRDIITALNVVPDAISIMYIQLNNIPGYNDAAFTLQLQKKEAKASMTILETTARTITVGENVKLTWASELAKRLTLEYKDRNNQHIVLDSLNGDIKLDGKDFPLPQAPTAEYTVIVATAYGASTQVSTKELTIMVTQLPAAIQKFTITPQIIDITANVSVTLTWEVLNASKLILTTPDGDKNVTGQTGLSNLTLQSAFTFTLTAYSYYTQVPAHVTATARVLGYRAERPIQMPLAGNGMQYFPAIWANERVARIYAANISNNTIYEIDSKTLSVTKTFAGCAMIQNHDGSKIFVYNGVKERPGVAIYDVVTGAHSGYTTPFPRQVPGPYPGKMLISPDTTRLYWSVTYDSNVPPGFSNIALLNVDPATNWIKFAEGATCAFTDTIYAMALNSDASKLYTAYEHHVSVTRLADREDVGDLQFRAKTPVKFVTAKTGGRLYLACCKDDCVVVIDSIKDVVVKIIALETGPVNIVLSPDDKQLYVALQNSDTILIIDTESNSITGRIQAGKYPHGMAFSADGGLLFSADYCSNTLSLIDVKSKPVMRLEIPTGAGNGNPLDVAVYNEDPSRCKVFVVKESSTDRRACSLPTKNTTLDVSVFLIQSPPLTINDDAVANNETHFNGTMNGK